MSLTLKGGGGGGVGEIFRVCDKEAPFCLILFFILRMLYAARINWGLYNDVASCKVDKCRILLFRSVYFIFINHVDMDFLPSILDFSFPFPLPPCIKIEYILFLMSYVF